MFFHGNTESLQKCIRSSSCTLLVFTCLGKNVRSEEMHSLFSSLSLSGFRKLDYAQLANHLRKVILNSVVWNSGCGACHQTSPLQTQPEFKAGERETGGWGHYQALVLLGGMDILTGGLGCKGCMGLWKMIPWIHICRLMGQWVQCTNDSWSVALAKGT